jgi:hypothetical protein
MGPDAVRLDGEAARPVAEVHPGEDAAVRVPHPDLWLERRQDGDEQQPDERLER